MSDRFLQEAWESKEDSYSKFNVSQSQVFLDDDFLGSIIDRLRESEWSDVFEKLMRNRLVMGAFRYNCIHEPNKVQYDRVSAMFRRLTKYVETGNTELLVDIANLALLEFEEGDHPNKHFRSEDDGIHVTALL